MGSKLRIALLASIVLAAPFGSNAFAQTPTPVPPLFSQPGFYLEGTAWIDAVPAPFQTRVQALIGGVLCGEGEVLFTTTRLPLLFSLRVATQDEKDGCGTIGSTVSFRIGDQPANETVRWDPVAIAQHKMTFIDLSAGDPFAAYSGPMSIQGKSVVDFFFPDGNPARPIVVDALIENSATESVVCGQVTVGEGSISTAFPNYYQYLIVPSASQEPDCGREGVSVHFRIGGAVITEAPWSPGFHQLSLETNAPIITASPNPLENPSAGPAPPDVGQGEAGDTWSSLAPILVFGGFAAMLVGLGSVLLQRKGPRNH